MKKKFFFLVIPLVIIVGCIMVSCEKDPYIIEASAGLGGIISPSGKIEVVSGGNLNITFTPDVGFEIDIMKVDGIVTIPANLSYTFSNIILDHRLEVTFKKIVKYTIEASAGLGGSITPSGKMEVVSGSNLDFTLIPNFGFKADSIKVNGIIFPLTSNTYSLLNVTKGQTVNVTFKKTLSWYATQGAWILDSVLVKQDDGTWAYMIINSRDSVLFFPTGRYKTYRDGEWIGEGNWSINESVDPPTFNYGGSVSNIGKLDNNELIMETKDIIDKYSHH